MAYRDPSRLTCPQCGLAGQVVWIVGTGPQTKPGEGPAYIRVLDAGPFKSDTHEGTTRVLCPHDGQIVAARSPRQV